MLTLLYARAGQDIRGELLERMGKNKLGWTAIKRHSAQNGAPLFV